MGDESGPTDGLNLIPGKVKKINTSQNQFIPHIGWNSVKILKNQVTYGKIKCSETWKSSDNNHVKIKCTSIENQV